MESVKNAVFPDLVVMRTENFIVTQDCEVPIPGFFIIAPKRRAESIADFTKEEVEELAVLLRDVRRKMKEILHIQIVYLFQNEDTGRSFHFWMFPRHDWMNMFGRKIESVRPVMDYAQKNMLTPEHLEKVRECAEKMRENCGTPS